MFVLNVLGAPMIPLVRASDDGWSLVMPLWLPYIIFTVVLLGLIVVSFARFHALRGAQYRNRQLADERSMGLNGAKNGFVIMNTTIRYVAIKGKCTV